MDAEPKQAPKHNRRDFLKGVVGLGAAAILSKTAFAKASSDSKTETSLAHPELPNKLFTPNVSKAEEIKEPEYPVVEGFPWTREEILFSPNAGFQKLREGGTVSVWIDPVIIEGTNYTTIDGSFKYWNRLGIDLRGKEYFKVAPSKEEADIQVVAGESTFVKPEPDFQSPFKHVIIFGSYNSTDGYNASDVILEHELGHAAFGFVDFLPFDPSKEPEKAKKHVNPQYGRDPRKPYSGIMNNDQQTTHVTQPNFGYEDDKKLLILGGYG